MAGMTASGSSGNLSVMSAGGSIYGMSPYSTSPLSVSGGGSAYLYQVNYYICTYCVLRAWYVYIWCRTCGRVYIGIHMYLTPHYELPQHHHDRERQGLRMHRSDSQSRNMGGAQAGGAAGMTRTRCVTFVLVCVRKILH